MTEEHVYNQIQNIIEINRMIVKQNALLIQSLTLPTLMVSGEKPGSWTEYPKEKNNG